MFREMDWLARDRQQQMLRETEQMRLHRLAAGRQVKPARPAWRQMLKRGAR